MNGGTGSEGGDEGDIGGDIGGDNGHTGGGRGLNGGEGGGGGGEETGPVHGSVPLIGSSTKRASRPLIDTSARPGPSRVPSRSVILALYCLLPWSYELVIVHHE